MPVGQAEEMVFPQHPGWYPADLQVHSTFSDGTKDVAEVVKMLAARGYRIVYFTDHTDLMAKRWAEYKKACYRASALRRPGGDIVALPGAEFSTGRMRSISSVSDPGQEAGFRAWEKQGDLLAYGIKDVQGLENDTFSPQEGIDNINLNLPGVSSAAIAHPYGDPAWKDWKVVGYRGVEIMSGVLQRDFGLNSRPVRRWRLEISRQLKDSIGQGYIPSPRAGSDYHGRWFDPGHAGYVTYIYLGPEWEGLPYWRRKASVDSALRQGKTVASYKGSLAFLTVNGQVPGTVLLGIDPKTPLALEIQIVAALKGRFVLEVYQDWRLLFRWCTCLSAGASYHRSREWHYPGGDHYYWLAASGDDYVYSSPIYASSSAARLVK